MNRTTLFVCVMLAAAALAIDARAADAPKFTAAQYAFFEKEVQPILVGKCLKCHGGEAKVASEFYVTSRTAVLRGGELGPAVDLERPYESQLLAAVRYESLEMPPSGKLPKAEIDVLTRWVKEGLPWPTHLEKEPTHLAEKKTGVTDEDRKFWAYQPIVDPKVPEVKNKSWVRTPIDAFILAKLEANGIAPSAAADPRELIRRITYDLTGLPPTPEEVEAFVNSEEREKAYEALVDRLLASPHYGEKWGRHWLDLVRYAETHGYERDSAKPFAWRYRDYVVQSLNDDKPYDVFLREQLAGDEMPGATAEQLVATGYYRLGVWDDEPADRELARYDELDGIAATTGGVVLGMSIGCARCHDHKRDPILQRDYYKLLAFFSDLALMNRDNLQRVASDTERADFDRRSAAKKQREAALYSEIYALEQKFLASAEKHGVKLGDARGADFSELRFRLYRDTWTELPDFDGLKAETVGEIAGRRISLEPASRMESIGLVFEGKLLVPTAGEYEFQAAAREGIRLIVDGRKVIDRPKLGTYDVTGKTQLPAGAVSFRLEFFNANFSPRLKLSWSGPGFDKRALSDEATPGARNDADTWSYVTQTSDKDWMKPGYDDSKWPRGKAGFGTAGTPGAKIGTVWNTKNIYLRRKFTLAEVPDRLTLNLHHDEDVTIFLNGTKVYSAEGYLRDYRRVTLDAQATAVLKKGENTLGVYCKQTGGGQYIDVRIADVSATLEQLVLEQGDDVIGKSETARYAKLVDDLNASRREKIPEPGIDVMCIREAGSKPTHILLRGLPEAKGDEVAAGVPEVLASTRFILPEPAPTANTSGKRTALAAWLTDPTNPATARVMANRLWQYHFGRGLVASSNDFGKLGELPTHPELLDWLAVELVRGEWRLKRMHRMILLSSTYRQSSRVRNSEIGIRNGESTKYSLSELRTPNSEFSADPDNRLWGRFEPRRLTAEEVRDSMLAVTGQLDLRVGGPSVYPPIPKEVLAGQSRPGEGWPTSKNPADANRRSVYVHVKRALQLPIMAAHDQADTDSSCAVRYVTTVPTQALGLLNGEFSGEQAAALAERLTRDAGADATKRVRRALELTLQRPPRDDEVRRDVKFVTQLKKEEKLNDADAWQTYCLMCLNANEFFYLD